MSTIKTVLTTIEKKKNKIAKFLILCCGAEFCISTLYRIYDVKDSRKQEETLINMYSFFFIIFICFHELFGCLVCRSLEDNMKVLTHYTGKGIITILLSFIYMSPSRGNQQNYSAILLFTCGIVCILADFNYNNSRSAFELAIERSKGFNSKNRLENFNNNSFPYTQTQEDIEIPKNVKVEIVDQHTKKVDNPYDIEEDF